MHVHAVEFHVPFAVVLFDFPRAPVFLFSETQIVKESFLEDINNILNSGDVPNLYAPDEMERIINGVRPAVKAAGKLDTRDAIFAHYIQTVRSAACQGWPACQGAQA